MELNISSILLGSVIGHSRTQMEGIHIEYLVISKNYDLYNYWNMKFGEHMENQGGEPLLYCTACFFEK